MLGERDVRSSALARKRDIRLLILGGVIATLLAIPGAWAAEWLEPHIPFLPHQPPTPTVLPTPRVSVPIHR